VWSISAIARQGIAYAWQSRQTIQALIRKFCCQVGVESADGCRRFAIGGDTKGIGAVLLQKITRFSQGSVIR